MLAVDYLPVTLDAVVGTVSSRAAQRATKTAIFTFASLDVVLPLTSHRYADRFSVKASYIHIITVHSFIYYARRQPHKTYVITTQQKRTVRNKVISTKLEMWANAQPDGRPAEYRWRPLFNDAKFG